jgi:hypothetical protein
MAAAAAATAAAPAVLQASQQQPMKIVSLHSSTLTRRLCVDHACTAGSVMLTAAKPLSWLLVLTMRMLLLSRFFECPAV